MITLAQAREAAQVRLAARLGDWAGRTPDGAALSLALKPPTEREMLADEPAAERWAREWSQTDLPDGVTVDWEIRSWRSIGRQRVPVRLRALSPDAVAAFGGGEPARNWRSLSSRAASLRQRFGADERMPGLLKRHAARLLQLTDAEFARVADAAEWLASHSVAGLRPRQLPIRGVDTKWFAAHRALVTALHEAATGGTALGIRDADPLVRLRILDPRLDPAGVHDFAAPASQLAAREYEPAVVFVFENLESVLAMPAWDGAIVVHGSGYAVDTVGRLGWVRRSPVIYWGDLDSNGFAILHRLRSSHADVSTALMDEDTLLAHRDLWVPEPTPNRGVFETLSGSEQRALQRLRNEGDVRLEQERIPWDTALAALRSAAFRPLRSRPR